MHKKSTIKYHFIAIRLAIPYIARGILGKIYSHLSLGEMYIVRAFWGMGERNLALSISV